MLKLSIITLRRSAKLFLLVPAVLPKVGRDTIEGSCEQHLRVLKASHPLISYC